MKQVLRTAAMVPVLLAISDRPVLAETAQTVCQDFGNFPVVGGTRTCVTSNGTVCKFRSETWGVSGGCS